MDLNCLHKSKAKENCINEDIYVGESIKCCVINLKLTSHKCVYKSIYFRRVDLEVHSHIQSRHIHQQRIGINVDPIDIDLYK